MGEGEGDVKVLNSRFSMFGMRVLIALEEKNVPYELIEEDLRNKSKLLVQSNPIHKKIPVLLHKGKPICESSIIVEYINETWPSPPLFDPSTPYNTSLHRFWANYIDNKFYNAGLRVYRSPAGEAQEGAIKDLSESYKMMEKALTEMSCGVKPFFGGDSMGFVDIVFAPFISWFHTYETIGGFKLPGEDECPLLSAWVKRVLEVPSVKKALPDPHRILDAIRIHRHQFYDAGLRVYRSPIGESQEGAIKDLLESYKMMEKALVEMNCGVKPFFGGASMGFVDIVFAPFISWFHTYETIGGFKLPREDECPIISAWVKRVLEVPSIKKDFPNPHRILDVIRIHRHQVLNTNQ